MKRSLGTNGKGRNIWNPLTPTIDYLNTVGISSGSVLDSGYDPNYHTNRNQQSSGTAIERNLWTPLRPTSHHYSVDFLSTVGISSGSVLAADYDEINRTDEEDG